MCSIKWFIDKISADELHKLKRFLKYVLFLEWKAWHNLRHFVFNVWAGIIQIYNIELLFIYSRSIFNSL